MVKTLLFLFISLSIFASDVVDPEKISYNPTYVVRRGMDFGKQQSEYLKRAKKIIARTQMAIQESVKKKQDLKALFFEILTMMANERRQIARDHQTTDSENFGERRDLGQPTLLCHTILCGHYTSYRQPILNLLKTILSQMEHDEKQFIKKKHYVENRYLGRSSSIEIRILEERDKKSIKLGQGRVPEWVLTTLFQNPNKTVEERAKFWSGIKRLNTEDPELYSSLRWTFGIEVLEKAFPAPFKAETIRGPVQFGNSGHQKSLYVQATISFEINGKMQPLYEYLTWLYRDPEHHEEDLLDRMARFSVPMIIHQNEIVLEETLKDLASVFEQIICWDGCDLHELKQLIALFRYEMICMPFRRGSAAITEWFEAALYGYHKIDYHCSEDRLVDLEAYACPFFLDFFKAYESMYSLK